MVPTICVQIPSSQASFVRKNIRPAHEVRPMMGNILLFSGSAIREAAKFAIKEKTRDPKLEKATAFRMSAVNARAKINGQRPICQ
jgi:hypothetical protein